MPIPNSDFCNDSGHIHFSQVESAMMTCAGYVVEKSTMEKIYKKADILKMVAEIRDLTRWTRDECMRQAKVKEQTGKDWYRKGKDIKPSHPDIVRITNLYQKIMKGNSPSEVEKARRQLDSAIEMWFKEGDIIAIRTLSTAAYREFFKIGKERGLKFPVLQDEKNVEGVIYYAVAALQSLHERLNLTEQAFYAWLSLQKPTLFADSVRIFFRSLNLVDSQEGKENFFNGFIRNNVDERQ